MKLTKTSLLTLFLSIAVVMDVLQSGTEAKSNYASSSPSYELGPEDYGWYPNIYVFDKKPPHNISISSIEYYNASTDYYDKNKYLQKVLS